MAAAETSPNTDQEFIDLQLSLDAGRLASQDMIDVHPELGIKPAYDLNTGSGWSTPPQPQTEPDRPE